MYESETLDSLVDRLLEAAESDENKRRLKRQERSPRFSVGCELPMMLYKLFSVDVDQFWTDPAYLTEVLLKHRLFLYEHVPDDQPVSATLDVWLGYYPEYSFLGLGVVYNREGVPLLQTDHPMTKNPDVGLIPHIDFYRTGLMPRILEWQERMREAVRGRMPIMLPVWGRGPLDLAIQFRGYEQFIEDTIERPGFLHELMTTIVDRRCSWYEQLWKHLGVAPSLGVLADDWINIPFITPNMFRDFLLPQYKRIAAFHGGLYGIHSCGNQLPIQKYLLELPMHNMEISPWTDMDGSIANIPAERGHQLYVGVHPNGVLVDSPAQIEAWFKHTTEVCRGRNYIVATSGLTPLTGPEEFIAAIRRFSDIAHKYMD